MATIMIKNPRQSAGILCLEGAETQQRRFFLCYYIEDKGLSEVLDVFIKSCSCTRLPEDLLIHAGTHH